MTTAMAATTRTNAVTPLLVVVSLLTGAGVSAVAQESTAQRSGRRAVDFARDIRPVLSEKCFRCHGPDAESREADLRLDTRDGALSAENGDPAIRPGKPLESPLFKRIISTDPDERMPPPDSEIEPLTPEEQRQLKAWIADGARYETHWSFRPIKRPAVPTSASPWPRNEIDHFILAQPRRLELGPSAAADRRTLIRRLSLDLIGLPPSAEEVAAFVSDRAIDAYEQLVERLLASPHFGERWGRHWLDQARYADTNGYTVDSPRTMWPYRDWVIGALNRDLPFDRFTIEQLAGDLLPSPTREQLVATGFHRNTLVNQEGGTDREQFRVESVVDRVNTTGAVWLGMTVGCGQCHSHKFDPLTQREYYGLFAFFNHTADVNSISPTVRVPTREQSARLEQLEREIGSLKEQLKRIADMSQVSTKSGAKESDAKPTAATEIEQRIERLEKERASLLKKIPTAMVMKELPKRRPDHVLIRGDFLRRGDRVEPHVPAFLPALDASSDPPTRLDLAKWLVRRDHPLTARVAVNRIWMHLMGSGLVETENDFGVQGTPPSHPALLDYLAVEFIDRGWSVKSIIRHIVLSATYRQSSAWRVDLLRRDPGNRWRARQSRWRVEAEVVRDAALSVSGLLDPRIGGPSVYPPQPKGVYAFTQRKASWPTSRGAARYRRGLYTFFMRSAPYPLLTTFDTPRMNTTCTRRTISNTPLQALTLANSEALFECARRLGQAVASAPGGDEQRIRRTFERCLGRPPSELEHRTLLDYLRTQRSELAQAPADAAAIAGAKKATAASSDVAAWILVARVLLNLDEFITRE